MKKLTQFINEALGGILPREFAKIWKGEHINIDDDHLKNASYVFTELMNAHRDKLPTTEEFANMCRWFADTYKDQSYVTEEYAEELIYRFFDTFVMRTQKRTFTKEIKHIKYIDLGHDDLFKGEISYEYLTKICRDTCGIDDNGGVGRYHGYGYDNIGGSYIPLLLPTVLYMSSYIKRKKDDPRFETYKDVLNNFFKRWKISLKDFVNKHDYSEGMRILGKTFKK